jgi:S1-C subfamily serine protease
MTLKGSGLLATPVLAAVLVAVSIGSLLAPRPAWVDPPPDKVADVVARVQDCVVHIISVQPAAAPRAGSGNNTSADSPEPHTAIGSRFIIDPSRLVMTNRHVVENAAAVSSARLTAGAIAPSWL